MHVFLGFEPYLLTSSQAKCRVAVSTSHFKVHMAGTVEVNARVWVSWALAKNEPKTNKITRFSRFSWFWALFVIKQWSRVEGSSLNNSGVGIQGWYSQFGSLSLNLLSVSKKMSGILIKMHLFCFEPFLLSNSESGWRVVVPTHQV